MVSFSLGMFLGSIVGFILVVGNAWRESRGGPAAWPWRPFKNCSNLNDIPTDKPVLVMTKFDPVTGIWKGDHWQEINVHGAPIIAWAEINVRNRLP